MKCAAPVIWRSGRTSTPARVHVEQEERDAAMFRRRRIGAGEQQAEVCVVRTGRPHLLTVDHELVTVGDGARAEVREVGARVGLAEQLAPDLVRAQQRPEVARLLVGAPVGHQRRTREGDRRRDEAAAHVVARFLLAVDRLLPRSAAAPAVLRPAR